MAVTTPVGDPWWAYPTVAPSTGLNLYPCNGQPQHDYAVGPTHAVCNRCSKVVPLGEVEQ